ncbi:MAG: hypothetical protein AAGH76_10810 [Pseudomonadota bacterium]
MTVRFWLIRDAWSSGKLPPMRPVATRTRRTVWLTLFALTLPALVPAGYMPANGGFLALCPAGLPPNALQASAGEVVADAHHAHHAHHIHHPQSDSASQDPHAAHEYRCDLGDGLSPLALVGEPSTGFSLHAHRHFAAATPVVVVEQRRFWAYRSRAPPLVIALF